MDQPQIVFYVILNFTILLASFLMSMEISVEFALHRVNLDESNFCKVYTILAEILNKMFLYLGSTLTLLPGTNHLMNLRLLQIVESVIKLDRRVPPVLKQVSAQAFSAAQQAPVAAQTMASEVKRAGVVDTASGIAKSVYSKYEPTAKELYSLYEPKVEQCAVSTWRKLNSLPLFPRVAQVVVPAAAYCSEKYNQTIHSSAEKGYKISTYLPLVPTEKIAKVFGNDIPEAEPLVPGAGGSIGVPVH